MTRTALTFEVVGEDRRLTLDDVELVVGGYTGRDSDAVQHHIDELAAIGVPPPESIPAFYRLDPGLLTQSVQVQVQGANTSGEVEPLLIRHAGELFLSIGSDHTDRDMERASVRDSKAACPKPVGTTAIALGRIGRWDTIRLACEVDGVAYQRGSLDQLLNTVDVLESFLQENPVEGDLVLFGGTVPLIDGAFVPGTAWSMTLQIENGPEIDLHYDVTMSPDTRRA